MRFLIAGAIILAALLAAAQKAVLGAECSGRQIMSAKYCDGDGLNAEETRLYQMVNRYRVRNGLPAIPASPSLNLVANRHVRDIADNGDNFSRSGLNWLHGWSDCPYDAANPDTFSCMWEAPKRLETFYPGIGFEVFCGSTDAEYCTFRMTADYALKSWQASPLHNSVLLNRGRWKGYRWKAMGIAIHNGFAAIWFGTEPDPAAKKRAMARSGED
jgi:hypothetical protein